VKERVWEEVEEEMREKTGTVLLLPYVYREEEKAR